MTISTDAARVTHTGNGATTTFSVSPIEQVAADNVVVTLYDTDGVAYPQVLDDDYALGDLPPPGEGDPPLEPLIGFASEITFGAAPAAGWTVVIERRVALVQPVVLTPNRPFPATSVEAQLDEVTQGLQQLQDRVSRAIILSAADSALPGALPPRAQRASLLVGFDANGDLTTIPEPVGAVQTASVSAVFDAAVDGTFVLYLWAGPAVTWAEVLIKTVSGTADVQVRKNGVAIGGFSTAQGASATLASVSTTTAAVAGDVFDVVITNAVAPDGLAIAFIGQRTS